MPEWGNVYYTVLFITKPTSDNEFHNLKKCWMKSVLSIASCQVPILQFHIATCDSFTERDSK